MTSPRVSISDAGWLEGHPHVHGAVSEALKSALSTHPSEPLIYIAQHLIAGMISDHSVETVAKIENLRSALVRIASAEAEISRALTDLLPERARTSRAGYLKSLTELIGPCPSRRWVDEWADMLFELKCTNGELIKQADDTWVCSREFNWSGVNAFKGEKITVEWIQEHESVEKLSSTCEWLLQLIDSGMGWSREEVTTLYMLLIPRKQIASAMRRHDPCFGASTYAICEVLSSRCLQQEKRGIQPGLIYRTLCGPTSLAEDDPLWLSIETPDSTGFCGVCSLSVVRGDAHPGRFRPEGMTVYSITEQGYVPVDAAVVAFESHPEDEQGYHAAVMLERKDRLHEECEGVFPPNCLYRLKRIQEGFLAPGGVFVNQRLLVVTATYRPPIPKRSDAGTMGKLCSAATALSYGDRRVFVEGFDALVPSKPPLAMEMEYDRDMSWVDWCGVQYYLRTEWSYVNGPAETKEDCTPGIRDNGNDGLTVEDFCAIVREHISGRRADGCGLAMPEAAAYLTREEVLAVRLYSGPAYLPINNYLRQIAACTGSHRQALASHPLHTFAATCQHLSSAVRKLSAVATADELSAPLYRGVRGELKRSFWLPDEQGVVCAVDTAFMSCSRARNTPIGYMAEVGPNVLWELQPAPESDAAFHCGADIGLLSQFSSEQEVLFPPCTMLTVRGAAGSGGVETVEMGRSFIVVTVQPAFV